MVWLAYRNQHKHFCWPDLILKEIYYRCSFFIYSYKKLITSDCLFPIRMQFCESVALKEYNYAFQVGYLLALSLSHFSSLLRFFFIFL